MGNELLSIIESIERDKGIDRNVLIQAVEDAVATAARKSEGLGEEDEVTATIDQQRGRIVVTVNGRELASVQLTRIAAQTAKQVIIQKIREAEREIIFAEFQGRVGAIMTGSVHRFERGDIIVELGRAEAILPKAERIPHEEYHQGDRLQGYVVEVRKSAKGPAIVLSRTHEGFIRGLFALEVPEIGEGIVEIKGIAREPGDRTKIAVASQDEKVDCVGACVGMRGTRVKNIVRELHGEKVDIIRWHESIREFIAAALSPANISAIELREEAKQAVVIVADDQLSLAIGKKGQNVRLASKLTGWQLEMTSASQHSAAELSLRALDGVGPTMEARLREAGITTIQQVAALTLEQLTDVKGVGQKIAQKLLAAAKAAMAARTSQAAPADAAVPEGASPAEAQQPRVRAPEEDAPIGEPPTTAPPEGGEGTVTTTEEPEPSGEQDG
ncbi:MAG: transcription termination factor NusA [Candidatus Omnitrophota bacterium]|nr:transcription termination factor NusA [Candidatus Omnitrophota bacterium]